MPRQTDDPANRGVIVGILAISIVASVVASRRAELASSVSMEASESE